MNDTLRLATRAHRVANPGFRSKLSSPLPSTPHPHPATPPFSGNQLSKDRNTCMTCHGSLWSFNITSLPTPPTPMPTGVCVPFGLYVSALEPAPHSQAMQVCKWLAQEAFLPRILVQPWKHERPSTSNRRGPPTLCGGGGVGARDGWMPPRKKKAPMQARTRASQTVHA